MCAIVLDAPIEICRRAQQILGPMGIRVNSATSMQELGPGSGDASDLLIINLNGDLTGRQAATHPLESRLPLREMERRYILDTLQQVHGNRSQAAEILGISLCCLQYKVKEYRLGRRFDGVAPTDGRSTVMHLRRV
jgi:DNA-binding protein Fis